MPQAWKSDDELQPTVAIRSTLGAVFRAHAAALILVIADTLLWLGYARLTFACRLLVGSIFRWWKHGAGSQAKWPDRIGGPSFATFAGMPKTSRVDPHPVAKQLWINELMCFSATASFTAGTVLLGLGTLTLRSARHPRERPFAAIPLLFAIQQLIEGVIWLTFRHNAPQINVVMTYAYSFFSHVLWPIYVPLAVLLIEPPGWRRRALLVFVAVGLAVGGYLLYNLAVYPIVSLSVGKHIEYVSPHFFVATVMTLYVVSTTSSPLLSSHRMVKVFGLVALLSFAAAYYFYAAWFISVWCFFAALLSSVIYLHFKLRGTKCVDHTISPGRSP